MIQGDDIRLKAGRNAAGDGKKKYESDGGEKICIIRILWI